MLCAVAGTLLVCIVHRPCTYCFEFCYIVTVQCIKYSPHNLAEPAPPPPPTPRDLHPPAPSYPSRDPVTRAFPSVSCLVSSTLHSLAALLITQRSLVSRYRRLAPLCPLLKFFSPAKEVPLLNYKHWFHCSIHL